MAHGRNRRRPGGQGGGGGGALAWDSPWSALAAVHAALLAELPDVEAEPAPGSEAAFLTQLAHSLASLAAAEAAGAPDAIAARNADGEAVAAQLQAGFLPALGRLFDAYAAYPPPRHWTAGGASEQALLPCNKGLYWLNHFLEFEPCQPQTARLPPARRMALLRACAAVGLPQALVRLLTSPMCEAMPILRSGCVPTLTSMARSTGRPWSRTEGDPGDAGSWAVCRSLRHDGTSLVALLRWLLRRERQVGPQPSLLAPAAAELVSVGAVIMRSFEAPREDGTPLPSFGMACADPEPPDTLTYDPQENLLRASADIMVRAHTLVCRYVIGADMNQPETRAILAATARQASEKLARAAAAAGSQPAGTRGAGSGGGNAAGRQQQQPRCASCGAGGGADGTALKRCAGCRALWYCSADCQRRDWTSHKAACRAARAAG